MTDTKPNVKWKEDMIYKYPSLNIGYLMQNGLFEDCNIDANNIKFNNRLILKAGTPVFYQEDNVFDVFNITKIEYSSSSRDIINHFRRILSREAVYNSTLENMYKRFFKAYDETSPEYENIYNNYREYLKSPLIARNIPLFIDFKDRLSSKYGDIRLSFDLSCISIIESKFVFNSNRMDRDLVSMIMCHILFNENLNNKITILEEFLKSGMLSKEQYAFISKYKGITIPAKASDLNEKYYKIWNTYPISVKIATSDMLLDIINSYFLKSSTGDDKNISYSFYDMSEIGNKKYNRNNVLYFVLYLYKEYETEDGIKREPLAENDWSILKNYYNYFWNDNIDRLQLTDYLLGSDTFNTTDVDDNKFTEIEQLKWFNLIYEDYSITLLSSMANRYAQIRAENNLPVNFKLNKVTPTDYLFMNYIMHVRESYQKLFYPKQLLKDNITVQDLRNLSWSDLDFQRNVNIMTLRMLGIDIDKFSESDRNSLYNASSILINKELATAYIMGYMPLFIFNEDYSATSRDIFIYYKNKIYSRFMTKVSAVKIQDTVLKTKPTNQVKAVHYPVDITTLFAVVKSLTSVTQFTVKNHLVVNSILVEKLIGTSNSISLMRILLESKE